MKKFFTLIIAVLFSIGLNARTSLTQAVDFTSTDHDGNEIHLFEILDGGQYVLIDFFFTTCGPCQTATPSIVDAYYQLGCNEHDVFFLEVSPTDHNNSASNWINNYNVPYPTIHSQTGGNTGEEICTMYNIGTGAENSGAFPTIILIAPDRSIVLQDIYPVNSPEDIINPLTQIGIELHPCTGQEAEVIIEVTKERSTKLDVTFTPNAATVSYYYMISENPDLVIENVVAQGTQHTGALEHVFTDLVPNSLYYIYTVAVDENGNAEGLVRVETATLCDGGEGVSQINISIELTENEMVKVTAEPNAETSEYHYGYPTVAIYDEDPEAAIDRVQHDGYPLCDVDIWEVPAYAFGDQDYYVLAIGMNGEAEWGEVTLVRFNVATLGVEEVEMENISIYPNPATSNINIKSEMIGEGQVTLIDMTGRVVKNVNVTDMSNTTISVEDVADGVYFIKMQQNGNIAIDKVVIK